jgi:hypothetical protein
MNARKVATTLGVAGLALGLLGAGVGATYTDSATAAQNISVGTFSCRVSATDPHAVVSGNSVTINLPPILSSASSNYLMDVTVTNTGTIPQIVHWSAATGGTIAWQPSGRMGYAMGTSGDPMTTDLKLVGGASHTYVGAIGFMWAQLTNADFGQSAQVTYTASCGEVPPPPQSKVQFVGVASATGNTVTLPSGWQAGDIAIEMGMGPAVGASTLQNPAGFTAAYPGFNNGNTRAAYRVLLAGDPSTVTATNSSHTLVVVYRGVAGIGNGGNGAFGNNDFGSCALAATNVSNTTGSSWVVCLGGEITGTLLSTRPVSPSTPTPAFPATLRSQSITDTHFWVGDSNGGVTSWNPPSWQTGYFNPGTGASYAIELLSK